MEAFKMHPTAEQKRRVWWKIPVSAGLIRQSPSQVRDGGGQC